MWVLVGAVVVLFILVLPRLRSLRAGARLGAQLSSGEFGGSPVEKQFAAWFAERPIRQMQRQRFVDLASALGLPRPQVSERVMRSVMRAWKEPQTGYGAIVADEVDRLIAFGTPADDKQREAQRSARSQLEALKAELRRLDDGGADDDGHLRR